ncbi:aldo/keto reductase [Phyllobacterium sp. YR531]|uniref:aldo/keto reductase n=1 Tax=Phyllobacterium sp. YR531 TaxID=1144343 RepID=UPI00026F7505|nr:aldo/keto reductase [Phyllobacterium sp. YR531]EJN05171.1 aldo/keto reductase, diketogulonate reductase [Phyllobacterium sp. YR531]
MFNVNANGAKIPAIGFGTFRMPGADVLRMVPAALKLGYRHIDTAQIYGNEAEVGEAIHNSGVPRGEIFLTTKVWVDKYKHDAFIKSVDESLSKLKTDYVDLLLLHWPKSDVPLAERIGALNEVRDAGKVHNIGVSNFSSALMADAVKLSKAPIVTNQVEYHPYLDQSIVLKAARDSGMSITAYYAMADGKVINDPVVNAIAAAHGKSEAQIVLRWLIQQESVITLSKTVSEERARNNFEIFDFELTNDEMQALHSLARADGRIVNPGNLAPNWD